MWHRLPQVPALHLQLLLLAGWSGRHGRGHLDAGPQERLHQPAGLGHLPGHSLHPGGGGHCCYGDRGAGLLCHLQGEEEPAASVLRPAPHHLSAGDHCRGPGLRLLPAAERRAQGEPQGHHDQAVPPAGPRGRDQRCGQAAAGVPLLRQQQLAGLAGQRVDPLGRGGRTSGPRQLLQDRGAWLWAAGPRLQHLQSGGRLHHQAGDLHPGAPEDHRGRGPGHCLCTGVRDALHLLPVQEPEAGALLSVSTGTRPPCAAASRHALTTDTPESQSAAVQAATLPPPLPGRLFHCLDPHCAITVPSGNPQAPEAASSAFSYTPKSQDLRSAPPICWAGG